jgi:pimeloyl-ACP methyl ester carboxylesterase
LKNQLLVFLLVLSGLRVFSQVTEKKGSEPFFRPGYRSVFAIDSSRTYKPGVPGSDKFYLRPVEIDIWYPASDSNPQIPMLFGDFIRLLEQRSNRFQNDTVYKSLTSDLVRYLGFNLKVPDSAIVHLKTSSYMNAEPVQQYSPLILYMSSYNGISYENLGLFEFLASHGYVVACITSVGRYPGNMTTKTADLIEQVDDGYFAMRYLKKKQLIDPEKISVIGYSWGGLAALLLTMKTNDIKALLSLDGSEIHYYGDSREEDKDFNDLRNSSFFRPDQLKVPYAYVESGNKLIDRQVDSIFDLLPMISSNKFYVRFPKASHEDFSFLPSIDFLSRSITEDSTAIYSQMKVLTLNFEDKYLKNKNSQLSRQLNFIYWHSGDSTYPVIKTGMRSSLLIKGRIVDLKTSEGIAYVNIGISNKNLGTVSQKDGSFQINISAEFFSDSLTISMAGYQTRTIAISKLTHDPAPLRISLNERFAELNEVIVTKKILPVKILGNTTTSNFISVGLPLKFLGSEVGVRINLGKTPVLLKKFSFNVSGNRLDTAVFRMNIYNIKKGLPFDNVLQKNILIHVGKQTGLYTVDLTEYRLEMKGEIFLSLEWIEGSSAAMGNGAIFLSAGFLNSSTWHRVTSQGEWKKAPGLGVGLNVEIQKLPVLQND